jgi:hypothetical protein
MELMRSPVHQLSRREFLSCVAQAGLICSMPGAGSGWVKAAEVGTPPDPLLTFPGAWGFQLPKSSIIIVSDQQLEDLQDPDREIDLSLSATPYRTSLTKLCQQAQAAGAKTIILAFDEFWSQYRPGQGGKPRLLTPDTDEYIQKISRISETLKRYGLGLELSLLSPLEIGPAYMKKTGESGRWVQYREGWRDPVSGRFEVALWEQRFWTNNKGTIELVREGTRVFAFKEHRVGRTHFYRVAPSEMVELNEPPGVEVSESSAANRQRRLTVRGQGDAQAGPLDRVLVIVSYRTPELDYFSPNAAPFLEGLVERYHQAGVALNGLYADEMHIQQDWGYSTHHDEGQFTLRYLTANLGRRFAELYGAEFADLEKYLVYFCYGQHGFMPNLEARLPAQHVLGNQPDDIQRTFLLRRRYFDLLEKTVVDLFVRAKTHAERLYGHDLESRAHATWAQSPTIDFWDTGNLPHAPRQYEYTPDFLWSNTVQQAAAACSDYFRWNDFLTGGGNDHAEGGWSDRDYYGLALACSTGILNKTPNAYAAAWGMPDAVGRRHQALADAYGDAASPAFQAIENGEHRDVEVLMLYPMSLVACEERFGSWMTQYGYANYITPEKLLERGEVGPDGWLHVAGRRFNTVAVLFEPLPPAGLLPLLERFTSRGGQVIWSGPPPRLDFSGKPALDTWRGLSGIEGLLAGQEGSNAGGSRVEFEGRLRSVPAQIILTDFLVDLIYPVKPEAGVEVVARAGDRILGVSRTLASGGSFTYLGFRPRDDQAASLGYETRTWFEILRAVGAYPKSRSDLEANDNPSVVSRESPYLATRFPNGATVLAAHYRRHVESWPGGFHRDPKQDAEILAKNPLPSDELDLRGFLINGYNVDYHGKLIVGFRLGANGSLIAFGGHDSGSIRLNGREYTFADHPMGHIAWASVAENRRVPNGAIMELWTHGQAKITIPLPDQVTAGQLVFQGPRLGSAGGTVPATIKDGQLHFEASDQWPQKHLYLLPG